MSIHDLEQSLLCVWVQLNDNDISLSLLKLWLAISWLQNTVAPRKNCDWLLKINFDEVFQYIRNGNK